MQIPLLNQIELPDAKASSGSSSKRHAPDSSKSSGSVLSFSKTLSKANSAATVRENEPSAAPKTESPDPVPADSEQDPQVVTLDHDTRATQTDSATPRDTADVPADERQLENDPAVVTTGPLVMAPPAAHELPIDANAAQVLVDIRATADASQDYYSAQTLKSAEGASTRDQDHSTTLQPTASNSGDRAQASAQETLVAHPGATRVDASTDRAAGSREQSVSGTETHTRPGPLAQPDGQATTDAGERDSSSPRDDRNARSPSLPQIVGKGEATPAVSRANEVNLTVRANADVGDRSSQTTTNTGALVSSALAVDIGARVETNSAPQLAQVTHTGAGADVQPPETRTVDNTYRLVRGMQTMLNARGGVINMRLDPPELGTMRIVMSVHNGSVSATFEVKTAAAMNVLNQSMTALRQSLEQQGLLVERLHVHTAPQTQSESNLNHDRSSEEQDRSRFADAGQGESRGRRDESHSDDRTTDNGARKTIFTLTPNQ